MRKLFNEFLHIPKYGKLCEKVILSRFTISIAIIVFSLIAMSFSAYAYFTCNITSGSNFIKSSNFEAQITITEGANPITLTTDGDYQVATLEKGKTYNITLAPPTTQGSAKTGFCVIAYEGGSETYHTQQLGADKSVPNEYTPSITFYLTVSENTKVFFDSHWGTSTHYNEYNTNSSYICDGNTVSLTVNKTTNNISELDEGTTTYYFSTQNANNNIVESTPPTETIPFTSSTPNTETTTSTESAVTSTETSQPAEVTTSETTVTSEPTSSTTSTETSQPIKTTTPTTTETDEPNGSEEESKTQTIESSVTETSSAETETIEENDPATKPAQSTDTPPTETNE